MEVLKTFSDSTKLVFQQGAFDKYQVALIYPNGRRWPPRDSDFFRYFLSFQDNQAVWQLIHLQLAPQIIKTVPFGSLNVPTLQGTLKEDQMFSAYAATLIAEENKILKGGQPTKLGKRVKLIGAYQVLVQGWDPDAAARWSFGKPWRDIDVECRKYGL